MRSFLRATPVAVLAGIISLGCGPEAEPTPPNVILIVIDDMGWMDSAVYGSSFYDTPNIDRLAAGGARFTQFYTASPVCSPTRASLMTGRHPARLNLTNWIGGEQNGLLDQAEYIRQLPHEEVTFGEEFNEAGYVTGYIGKWHLGGPGFLAATQGFDVNFAVNHAGQPGSYFPPYENPDWPVTNVPDLADDPPDAYLTDRLTDEAVGFIEDHHDNPFLLVLSHYAVHTPLQGRADDVAKYESRAAALETSGDMHYRPEREAETKLRQDHPQYAAMVESTDRSVGRLLDRLEALNIDERTAVLFVSDNGGLSTLMRRSPNQATSNVPLRAGKGWLYEGGIRAPLIVWWPGVVEAGKVVNAPTMSTDLYPTMLDLAGMPLQPDRHADGVSLTGLMKGETEPSRDLFWHFPHYHGSGNRPSGAVRSGDLKLVEWFEDGAVELYDLGEDLSEQNDLAEQRPDDTTRLLALLKAWRVDVDANMPTVR